ncbi:MAG: GIY-YIG nuclease family protein [Desulfobacterales bacterium]
MPGNRLSRQWVVYLIRCSDESLYCGITNNLKNRLAAHNSGRGAKYTKSRRPVELVGSSSEMTKSDALKLEYRVKRLPAGKKNLELSTNKFQMAIGLKKDLQAVRKTLETLVKKTESLLKAVDKLENKNLKRH